MVAVTISGYASVSKQLPQAAGLRLGIVNAEGLAMGQGGSIGDVRLGRLGTIIKPVEIPTSAATAPHVPTEYTVQPGETLDAVAKKFSLSADQVRWSNDALAKTDILAPGQVLMLPPVAGIVATVAPGDTAESLADRFHVSSSSLVDFNYLRDPLHLDPGLRLVIPGGRGADLFPRRASPEPPHLGSFANAKFSFGYCTWYVASRREVPWTGDAWLWFGGARNLGYRTGSTPEPGAIMVTWESWVGHVAYVEAVNADGSFVVSEMNYRGWGVLSTRNLRVKDVPLIGFVY